MLQDISFTILVLGWELASAHSAEENTVIGGLVPETLGQAWVGAHDNETDGLFEWVDGSRFDYKHAQVNHSEFYRDNSIEEGIQVRRDGGQSGTSLSFRILFVTPCIWHHQAGKR